MSSPLPEAPSALPDPKIHAAVMWSLALLVVATGFALSWWNVLDRNWLARAGCVVVALGIWSGLSAVFADRVFVRTYALRRRLLVRRLRRRLRDEPQRRDEEIAALEARLEERLDRHRGAHQISVGVVEATLLVAGTLLWGFGDLIRFVI